MAAKKQQRARKKNGKLRLNGGGAAQRVASMMPRADTREAALTRLIVDPCGAELAHGFTLTSDGVVQRFNRFITPVATTENAFAYCWNPASQTTNAIVQKLATGTGAPVNVATSGPGEAFIEANADYTGTLAACMEVLYTGTLMNRKGYLGVCQVPFSVWNDLQSGTTDLPTLLTYCQHVAPVPSHVVELKWSPTIRNFTAVGSGTEGSQGSDNCLLLVAIGVNPTDFVVKFTAVYEYVPKFALGLPATRPSKTIPVGVGERIVSRLDRMGAWWHNLGDAAGAAYRLGAAAYYGAGQVARTAAAYGRVAAPLLALAG